MSFSMGQLVNSGPSFHAMPGSSIPVGPNDVGMIVGFRDRANPAAGPEYDSWFVIFPRVRGWFWARHLVGFDS